MNNIYARNAVKSHIIAGQIDMENSEINKQVIAVWFSCGAASAVAAKKTIEKYGNTHTIRVLNNPVKEEHSDNIRFKNDIANWLGVDIETVFNSSYPSCSAVDVWDDRQYMSSIKGAPCTSLLKKDARRKWEMTNHCDYMVLGYTYDEQHRHQRAIKKYPNIVPVLIDMEITKQDCFNILHRAGIKLPEIYSLGFPNANCIGCVKATSPTYWNLVRKTFPDIFNERAEQSRELNVMLARYKGKRIYLDELPSNAKGNKLKGMDVDCGLFCWKGE